MSPTYYVCIHCNKPVIENASDAVKAIGQVCVCGHRSHTEAAQAVRGSDAPKNKYGAQRTNVDGEEFDSKKEAARWKELQLLRKAGEITALQRQVIFNLPGNSRYVADFVYYEVWKDCAQRGEWVVEDVKSEHTRTLPMYRLKKRQVLELYGIEIREI